MVLTHLPESIFQILIVLSSEPEMSNDSFGVVKTKREDTEPVWPDKIFKAMDDMTLYMRIVMSSDPVTIKSECFNTVLTFALWPLNSLKSLLSRI